MDRAQWEALCDGCGKCCLHKLEDEETGELLATNVACRLLDRRQAQCADYRHRHAYVAECVRLTPRLVRTLEWLPSTCAYRLLDEGKPLPAWHYLVSGDRDAVHAAGQSTRGWTVSEDDAGDLEHHIVDRDL
ncbi:YcgN family cysteine cluster protein [Sphingomonas guangdongensis]